MSILSRNKKNFSPGRVADGVPQALSHGADALAHGAGEASNRIAGAVGSAGSRAQDVVGNAGARAQKRKRFLVGSARRAQTKLTPSSDAILKAQLVRTSRELARESSDLGSAVDSLNSIIKANRKASAKGRTRLIGGLALGAGLMYHLDAEHGRARRIATARRLGITVGDHS
jgi:hypothetical protein